MKTPTESPDLFRDATKMVTRDYFAVYVRRNPKATPSFLLHAHATDATHAMKMARDQGHTLPRGSFAQRVGKEGYYAALRAAFR